MPDSPRPLTPRQRQIYAFIATKIRSVGWAPSFEEIAKQFSLRSLATVHEHLETLERKGYIRRRFRNASRAIEIIAHGGACPHCGADLAHQQPTPPLERSVGT